MHMKQDLGEVTIFICIYLWPVSSCELRHVPYTIRFIFVVPICFHVCCDDISTVPVLMWSSGYVDGEYPRQIQASVPGNCRLEVLDRATTPKPYLFRGFVPFVNLGNNQSWTADVLSIIFHLQSQFGFFFVQKINFGDGRFGESHTHQ